MGAKSRRKGKSGELEVVALAREAGFAGAHRTAPMQAGYGNEYPDVDGVGSLWIEVKRYRRVPVNRFAKETLGARLGYVPVLAHRDDGGEWLVTLSASEFLKLANVAKQFEEVD